MELLLTEDQRLLQDSVAKMLAQAGGVKRTRDLRNNGAGFDKATYARMASEGWFSLLVPPDRGGLGLSLTELGLVMQEAGRALAPEPIAAAAASAVMLAECDEVRAASLMEAIVAGEALVMPVTGGNGVLADAGSRLSGKCDGVAVANAAEGFLVEARNAAGPMLSYVPRDASGLTIEERRTVDGRPFACLTLSGVAPQFVLTSERAAQRLHDVLLFATAAELVGVMSAALDLTVEYLKTRKQFGKPIGSFQALQHRAVDDFARIVSARSFVFQVASQPAGLTPGVASALKAHCGAMALEVTKSAIQMHGAIGFTDEYDAGLYLKRAMWLSAWLGNEAEQRKRFIREHATA